MAKAASAFRLWPFDWTAGEQVNDLEPGARFYLYRTKERGKDGIFAAGHLHDGKLHSEADPDSPRRILGSVDSAVTLKNRLSRDTLMN